jgi:hypothetical protein
MFYRGMRVALLMDVQESVAVRKTMKPRWMIFNQSEPRRRKLSVQVVQSADIRADGRLAASVPPPMTRFHVRHSGFTGQHSVAQLSVLRAYPGADTN